MAENDDGIRIRITGHSEVAGCEGETGVQTDGRDWEHEVKLDWLGYIDMDGNWMKRLLMTALGTERLVWTNRTAEIGGNNLVSHLPVGRAIDLECGARYGMVAEPADPL